MGWPRWLKRLREWLKRSPASEPEPGPEPEEAREPTYFERRLKVVLTLVDKVIKPWKKAVEARDRIIATVVAQRDALKSRLDEYVVALGKRDEIIKKVVEQRDDLRTRLEALETAETPAPEPEVVEHDLPESPEAAPDTGDGSEEVAPSPEAAPDTGDGSEDEDDDTDR